MIRRTPPSTPVVIDKLPLQSLDNVTTDNKERTPVGDRDNTPKIQVCMELRKKGTSVKTKGLGRKATSELGLVLEVAVMYIKNLPRGKVAGNARVIPTFVKIRLSPGDMIHSTELKMDKKYDEKVDLIEFFDFPLDSVEDLKGKTVNVLVCDRKMTRNASIFGQTEISVGDICMGKPVCKWYPLSTHSES